MALDEQEFTPKGEFKLFMDMFKDFRANVEKSLDEMKALVNNVIKTKDTCHQIFVKEESLELKVRKIICKEREERLNDSNTKTSLANGIFNIAYKVVVVGAIVFMVLQNTGVL